MAPQHLLHRIDPMRMNLLVINTMDTCRVYGLCYVFSIACVIHHVFIRTIQLCQICEYIHNGAHKVGTNCVALSWMDKWNARLN